MIEVTITKKTQEAQHICSFELQATSGENLPPFTPGSHIDVHLGQGLIRQYSLTNHPYQQNAYYIAVLNDPDSRGGSSALHEQYTVGDTLTISEPRNLFPLTNDASHYVLVAGGIGITPILSMAQALSLSKKPFTLFYFSRSSEQAAFVDFIQDSNFASHCHFLLDNDDNQDKNLLPDTLAKYQPHAHLYVCGPDGFMDFILNSARNAHWDEARLHKEHFSNALLNSADDRGFTVEIASTGQLFNIPADKSVYEVLSDAGIDIQVSCEQGICGTCITKVISGIPDHKDQYLTEQEHQANNVFTPCCSRAFSEKLVIELTE